MPVITLPDGSQKTFDQPVTIMQVAESIGPGLAKAAIAGRVNNELIDTCIPINDDASISIIKAKNQEGIEIIRHSFAHCIGHTVKQIKPAAKKAIKPVSGKTFYVFPSNSTLIAATNCLIHGVDERNGRFPGILNAFRENNPWTFVDRIPIWCHKCIQQQRVDAGCCVSPM